MIDNSYIMTFESTDKANQEKLIIVTTIKRKVFRKQTATQEKIISVDNQRRNVFRKKPKRRYVLCTPTHVYCVSAVVIHSLEFSLSKI